MTHLCIFCGRRVDSDEHVWPQWLLRLSKKWPSENRRMQATRLDRRGTRQTWNIDHPTIVTKVVCKTKCNSGWMSDLEERAERVLTPLIDGRKTILTVEQQITVAAWMIKCAMVFDGMEGDEAFYDKSDRFHFRKTLEPSDYTNFWLGYYDGPTLKLFTRHGTKSSPQSRTPFKAYIFTVAFGRLVIQMLDFKFVNFQDWEGFRIQTIGQWSSRTVDLLSQESGPIEWPPSVSFDDSHHTFDKFSDRFGRLI